MWAKVGKAWEAQKEDGGLFADERCREARVPPDYGRWQKGVEKAETESTELGAEQECPRGEYVCGLCGW